MLVMALTNDYKACRVYDLHPQNRRLGPFIVTQTAIDAEDPQQREEIYLLRRDGVWISLLHPLVQESSDRCLFCFGTMGEIVQLLQNLPPEARVERAEAPPEKMAQWLAAINQAGGPLAFIEERVLQWREGSAP
ncbi:MAG: hypothetical protein N3J91_11525 [Verrucomicrobiae bacterium]|nr:hypothetical protein [Verrucomicrobiae bacterium]